MSYPVNDNPFDEAGFLQGLEAAGYLQRLDTSEARITARYQHALKKMSFAAYSEEFLTMSGVRKVHGSTVQFFNEAPVSDPFVHVMVGSLPPARQALVTPVGLPTAGFTPIGSPDEADGTIHFTVSIKGFWPLTYIVDANSQDLPHESNPRWKSADSDSDDSDANDDAVYNNLGRGGGSGGRSGSRSRGASDSAFARDGGLGSSSASGRASRTGSTAYEFGGASGSRSARSARRAAAEDEFELGGAGGGGAANSSRRRSLAAAAAAESDSGSDEGAAGYGRTASAARSAGGSRRSASRSGSMRF